MCGLIGARGSPPRRLRLPGGWLGDGVAVRRLAVRAVAAAAAAFHPGRLPPRAAPHPAADAPGHPGRRRDRGPRALPPRRPPLHRARVHGLRRPHCQEQIERRKRALRGGDLRVETAGRVF